MTKDAPNIGFANSPEREVIVDRIIASIRPVLMRCDSLTQKAFRMDGHIHTSVTATELAKDDMFAVHDIDDHPGAA